MVLPHLISYLSCLQTPAFCLIAYLQPACQLTICRFSAANYPHYHRDNMLYAHHGARALLLHLSSRPRRASRILSPCASSLAACIFLPHHSLVWTLLGMRTRHYCTFFYTVGAL